METKTSNEIKTVGASSSVGVNVVNNAFKNWASQTWFKGLFCIIMMGLLCLFIQVTVSKTLNKTMDIREREQRVEHTISFQNSKHAYSLAKKIMVNYIDLIDCDYLFLLEYHNGAENIVTGLQFCKFDMTLEVSRDNVEVIPMVKFKDDIIARYDILLSDEMDENKIIVKTIEQVKKEDPYLYYQLASINTQKVALFNLKDKNSLIYASLLGVSTSNDNINEKEMILCSRELENILVIKHK